LAAPSAPEQQGYYGQQGYAPPAYYPPTGSAAPKKGVSTGVIVAVAAAVVAVGVVLIGIVAAIAIPSLLAARRASNEAAVVGSLRTIGSAEATYISQTGESGTLAQLVGAKLLADTYANGKIIDNYRLTEVAVDPEAMTFEFKMEPISPSNGTRSYNIIEDYVIRYKTGPVAPSSDRGTPIGEREGPPSQAIERDERSRPPTPSPDASPSDTPAPSSSPSEKAVPAAPQPAVPPAYEPARPEASDEEPSEAPAKSPTKSPTRTPSASAPPEEAPAAQPGARHPASSPAAKPARKDPSDVPTLEDGDEP
jgi:type II secretory pathway pseudopilin PulG